MVNPAAARDRAGIGQVVRARELQTAIIDDDIAEDRAGRLAGADAQRASVDRRAAGIGVVTSQREPARAGLGQRPAARERLGNREGVCAAVMSKLPPFAPQFTVRLAIELAPVTRSVPPLMVSAPDTLPSPASVAIESTPPVITVPPL